MSKKSFQPSEKKRLRGRTPKRVVGGQKVFDSMGSPFSGLLMRRPVCSRLGVLRVVKNKGNRLNLGVRSVTKEDSDFGVFGMQIRVPATD